MDCRSLGTSDLASFHSFIHSGYFYSASPSPLLLRGSSPLLFEFTRSVTTAATNYSSGALVPGPLLALDQTRA